MARPSQYLLRVAPWALLWMLACPRVASANPASYTHQVPGEAAVWVSPYGLSHWTTDRAPNGDTATWVTGLGASYRMDTLRLAWRLHLHQDASGDAPLRFVTGEFVSVERVYRGDSALRPYWRLALGFGLDLDGADDRLGLGDDGYFSEANGASAGMMFAHGWGLDAFLGEQFFVRLEGTARAHMGAGRNGLLFGAHLGLGWAWQVAASHPRPAPAPDRPEPTPSPAETP